MRIRTPILMLHHVEPLPLEPPARHPDSYLSPEQLDQLLDVLDRARCTTYTLAAAARRWHRGKMLPRRSVVLTFDDGCRCFAERAAPTLASRDRCATVFVLSGLLGKTNEWDRKAGERREDLLDADELRRLDAVFEIGCHGRHHAHLPACDARELQDETAGAQKTLEALVGRPVETFCYPWGDFSASVREAVREAGFLAATGIEGHAEARRNDLWGLPRWSVRPGDSRFEMWLKVTGAYRWWRRLPRLGILGTLRRSARHRP